MSLPILSEDPHSIILPHANGMRLPRLALGCMHFGGGWDPAKAPSADDAKRAVEAFSTAFELGWRLFDHADIYCGGKSESLFPQVLRDAAVSREQVLIQTKCGIRMASGDSPHRFDFRPEYIIASVEGSLKRLQTDYIDILLLHRPDLLLEPQAVIDAFGQLRDAGKVRHFGVSNFTPSLLELMRAAGFLPVANQVELNLLKTSLLDSLVVSDEGQPMAGHPADGTLEYHRIHGISTQAWAPLAYGYPVGRKPDWDAARVQQLAQVVERIAAKYEVPGNAVVIAWLLRHPAAIMPIIGTRDPQRLRDCHRALELELSHEDWYALYLVGRGRKLP